VMVVNLNMKSDAEGNINDYLCDTISNVFSEVYVADVRGYTNRVLYASNNSEMMNTYADNCAVEDDFELLWMIDQVGVSLAPYVAGDYLMTDDKAPVELLGMQVIDTIIEEEVSYYKKIYDEQGLQGLLDALN